MSIWGEGSRVGVAVHADANNLKPSLKFVAKPRLDYVPSSSIEDAIDRFVRAVLESVGDASDGLGTEYRQLQSERTEPSVAACRKLEAMLGFDPDDAPDGLVPLIPSSIPIASRDGIDLDPVDLANPDQLLWLRALIWPEHLECHQQLIDAAEEFEHSDIRMHAGDSSRVLPALIETIPLDHAMVVYSTIALYQFPRESRQRIAATLAGASATRPVWQIALEGNDPELSITRYRNRVGETELLADASPHGWWIEWRSA